MTSVRNTNAREGTEQIKWSRYLDGIRSDRGDFTIRPYETRYNLRRVVVDKGFRLYRDRELVGVFNLQREAKQHVENILTTEPAKGSEEASTMGPDTQITKGMKVRFTHEASPGLLSGTVLDAPADRVQAKYAWAKDVIEHGYATVELDERSCELVPGPTVDVPVDHLVPDGQPFIHEFADTRDAYNASQTRDEIRDGDVLVAREEQAVAVLVQAWPTAVKWPIGNGDGHAAHGQFHRLDYGELWCDQPDGRKATVGGGKYAASVAKAVEVWTEQFACSCAMEDDGDAENGPHLSITEPDENCPQHGREADPAAWDEDPEPGFSYDGEGAMFSGTKAPEPNYEGGHEGEPRPDDSAERQAAIETAVLAARLAILANVEGPAAREAAAALAHAFGFSVSDL